ncbi:MAG: glycosyltransferase [Magnetococcales bacterium]|nr:glycosyltransferase [Magnetococcales bacterium]
MATRLLFVTTRLGNFGGIESTLRLLCRRLDPNRFRVGLCVLQRPDESVLRAWKEEQATLFILNRRGALYDPGTTLAVIRTIRRFRADLVHTHNNKGNLHGRAAAVLTGVKGIVTTHHDLGDARFSRTRPAPQRPPSKMTSMTERLLYPWFNVAMNRFNHRLIAVSGAVARIHAPDGIDARLSVVPAPFACDLFNTPPRPLSGNQLVIGSVGRLEWQKGFDSLIDAFHTLAPRYPDLSLRIVGEGSLRPDLMDRSVMNGYGDRIHIVGGIPHGPKLYHGMDLYVQPSLSEGSSITILEAMGLGLPVIATRSGGPEELIQDGRSGLLTPPGDATALAQAIITLLEKRDLAHSIAMAGQSQARKRFGSDTFITTMSHLYEALVRPL